MVHVGNYWVHIFSLHLLTLHRLMCYLLSSYVVAVYATLKGPAPAPFTYLMVMLYGEYGSRFYENETNIILDKFLGEFEAL